jgi:uncharacterized protein YcaQ
MILIDNQTAIRYILGRQGLWPGRRWRGSPGAGEAMRAIEYLQLDPLQMVARSQEILLHSRVADYRPGMWEELTYQQRQFFDWGGWLAVRPMAELPHWRVVMQREREGYQGIDSRIHKMGLEHAEAVAEMRAILRERGTVSNRDFKMDTRKRTHSYRGRKDSSLALYYLWRVGEVMTHHRENFERVYALAETVAPAHLLTESSPAEAGRFLFLKEIRFDGLSRVPRTAGSFQRGLPFENSQAILEGLVADGEIVELEVEGWKWPQYAPGEDRLLLKELAAGRVPAAWQPVDTTTAEEVVMLAPLDPVSARRRAKTLFGFDYIWEVYKPEPLRKYGYYTLPILWGEDLVARFDSKFDRTTRSWQILGFWLEDDALESDAAFMDAMALGFRRFAAFLGAAGIHASGIKLDRIRKALSAVTLDAP